MLLTILMFLLTVRSYAATEVECEFPGVTVFSGQPKEGELACEAAGDALQFMQDQGFRVDTWFTITLVDHPLSLHGEEVRGTFNSGNFQIKIPTFSQARVMADRHPPFGMIMDHAMWKSFVVHEVAHAIAQANFRISEPSLEAHEYIAYVVQLATQPKTLRQKLLATYDNPAFQHERQISRIFLQLGPEVFAVKAYRHYVAQPDSKRFFQHLLNKKLRSLH